jgi:hypothetical protein
MKLLLFLREKKIIPMIVGPFEEPDFLPPFPFLAPLAAAFFGGIFGQSEVE